MQLPVDSRWQVFANTENHASFCKAFVPPLYLKQTVAQDIKDAFVVIGKLLEHRYFVYEFYDVAAREALFTFEMALKIRYNEITGGDWGNKPLQKLIDWFETRHYFEVYNEYFLDHLRWVRNSFAHRTRHGFGGPAMKQWILHPLDLINDLYESEGLRVHRMERHRKISETLASRTSGGAILTIGTKAYSIFWASVGFVNNKVRPQEITLFFAQTFPLEEKEKNGKERVPPMLLRLDCTTVHITPTKMDMKNDQGKLIATLKALPADGTKSFEQWKQLYTAYCEETGFDHYLEMEMKKVYDQSRREFHRL